MARQPIAVIALAPGEIGYYDDYSKIYLSNENPKTVVYAGTNLYQIRKSIASGRLRLVQGSLSGEVSAENVKAAEARPVVSAKPDEKKEENIPGPAAEEAPQQAAVQQKDIPVEEPEQPAGAFEEAEAEKASETAGADAEAAPKPKRRTRKAKVEEAEADV